jgi:hypothetical protein
MVPNGCSTDCRRMSMALSMRSRRACIRSRTASCLLTNVIASFSWHGELLTRHHIPGVLPHRRQSGAVVADSRHLVCDDQMMLSLHRQLDAVAVDAGALAAPGGSMRLATLATVTFLLRLLAP